jgi:hypothetical protein
MLVAIRQHPVLIQPAEFLLESTHKDYQEKQTACLFLIFVAIRERKKVSDL